MLEDVQPTHLATDRIFAVASVMLSLLVAVTLIPALSNGLLGGVKSENKGFRVPLLDDFAGWFLLHF